MTEVHFTSIAEALAQPLDDVFWVQNAGGVYTTGHSESFYAGSQDREHLTFNASNNKVLLHMALGGGLKEAHFCRGSYLQDNCAGHWVGRDITKAGPFAFEVRLGETTYELTGDGWSYTTGYLGAYFPLTRGQLGPAQATLLAFSPIEEDGTRPRAGIYALYLHNDAPERLVGSVRLPQTSFFAPATPDLSDRRVSSVLLDRPTGPVGGEVPFDLPPGASLWLPVAFTAPGDRATRRELLRLDSLTWLNKTWTYLRRCTGALEMPGDPVTGHFLIRSILQCLEAPVMDEHGAVQGANFGTYPSWPGVHVKDTHYVILPLHLFEPDLFANAIAWFLAYGVRPRGDYYAGGVTHSLSNSLSSVMMAVFYYGSTGDAGFFTRQPELIGQLCAIMDAILATREPGGPALFPSRFISDGQSVGDYHTGSNVCVWHALTGLARILDEIYGDAARAGEYRRIAGEVKAALEAHNIIDGPFGRQYVEGVNADGTLPCFMHDGEESDTALMPVYHYLRFDNPAYQNFARFGMSPYNDAYVAEVKGILWDSYQCRVADATFPGYIAALGDVRDAGSFNGPDGRMTEIRRLVDLNGIIWWWPYVRGARYGEVSRTCNIVHCGWATGVFVTLFVSEFLGLQYDAPSRTLRFRPCPPVGDFAWQGVRLGAAAFDVAVTRSGRAYRAVVTNRNSAPVALELEATVTAGAAAQLRVNGEPAHERVTTGVFLGAATLSTRIEMAAGHTCTVEWTAESATPETIFEAANVSHK